MKPVGANAVRLVALTTTFICVQCAWIFGLDEPQRRARPEDVADGGGADGGGPRVVQVSAGGNFACALLDDGSVKCWGNHRYGQLGEAPLQPKGCSGEPCSWTPSRIAFAPGVRIKRISAGISFACAISLEGKVFCWGDNGHGQLGHANGTKDDLTPGGYAYNPRPHEVEGLGGKPMTAISAGAASACAVAQGSPGAYCWGRNARGLRGLPEDQDAGIAANVVLGDQELADVQISLFGARACARTASADRGAFCWGSVGGPLGDDVDSGDGGYSAAPVRVKTSAILPLGGVDELATLYISSCARSGDAVRCWGANSYEGLGSSAPGGSVFAVPRTDLPPISRLAGNALHVCATTAGGDALCWGLNSDGELGRGHRDGSVSCAAGRCEPSPAPVQLPPAGGGAEEISAGGYFVLALRKDGTVWAWGNNLYGRLGHEPGTGDDQAPCREDASCSPTPQRVEGLE